MLKRSLVFLYGIASYAVFFVTYLYAIGFVGNVFVPRSIDGPSSGDLIGSILTDLALLAAVRDPAQRHGAARRSSAGGCASFRSLRSGARMCSSRASR